jgi:hypothetical protein
MTVLAGNLPNGRKYYYDGNGNPLAGGTVSFYIPGTTTLTSVYQDDQQLTNQVNPVTLDAAGSCIAFGAGQYREYVQDANGNLISDTVVSVGTPFVATAAMLPVLTAATPAAAEALLTSAGGGTTHLNIGSADQTITVAPIGNPPSTLTSFNVQGNTVSTNTREFLVDLGLTSSTGRGGTAGNDKVTLYCSVVGNQGTSDIWAINPLLTMSAGSGSYNAQCIELDFNNMNAARGNNGNLVTDFTAPVASGLLLTGASAYPSTSAISIEGSPNQWSRGITQIGKSPICGYQDWLTTPVAIQFDGVYTVAAINLTSLYNNAGAGTSTAMYMKNLQYITWQNNSAAGVISDTVDSGNNRIVGSPSAIGGTSSVILCGNITMPQTTGANFGTAQNRWGDAYLTNVRLPNADVISWQNNPAANGGVSALIYDYVDSSNNRIVGGGVTTGYCYMSGAGTAPISPGLSLGTSSNPWGEIFNVTGGITGVSDIRYKTNVNLLPSMLNTVDKIDPISFNYTDHRDDGKLHYGFNANDVKTHFPKDFAGFNDIGGIQHIDKTELIAVLWQAVQELNVEVNRLKTKVAEISP